MHSFRSLPMWQLLAFGCFLSVDVSAQYTVDVSSACITETITLSQISNVGGKPAYQGIGTVSGSNTIVAISWSGDDNAWLLMFDGQPYFAYVGNLPAPPNNVPGNWVQVEGTDNECNANEKVSINGSGTQSDPLPVTLVSFNGAFLEKSVLLEWSTTEEVDNMGFEIIRSSDLKSWDMLGFVDGSGTTKARQEYRFVDSSPSKGQNYYRLKQTDFSGRTTLSRIISVNNPKKSIAVYPNPVVTDIIFFSDGSNGWQRGDIFDMSGRKVASIQPGRSNISSLNPGNYLVRVTSSDGRAEVISFVKAR